jgi:hypothetical protein
MSIFLSILSGVALGIILSYIILIWALKIIGDDMRRHDYMGFNLR